MRKTLDVSIISGNIAFRINARQVRLRQQSFSETDLDLVIQEAKKMGYNVFSDTEIVSILSGGFNRNPFTPAILMRQEGTSRKGIIVKRYFASQFGGAEYRLYTDNDFTMVSD
ncbi:hypothetical protein HY448_00970 [Candidatus Pacearchaeota archaeon]|nr:hypothetical protein [Candidatus Pacearchaeota archaeon]